MAASKQRTSLAIAILAVVLGLVVVMRPWKGSSQRAQTETPFFDAGGTGSSVLGQRPELAAVKGTGEHSISGWVRGGDRGGIANALVTATLELGPGVKGGAPVDANAVVAISGADGTFVLEGLEPGRHRLRIEGEGLIAAEVRFVEAPGSGLVILISREVEVRGRIVGTTGSPSEVRIFLRSETSTQMREVAGLADGTFSIAGLPEGRFQVWAQGPGQASPTQWADRLGVGPFEEITVAMQTAHTLTGRVVEEGRSNFGLSAQVSVQSALGAEPARLARSNEDGSFEVEGLLEGRWIATASAPGYTESASQAFMAGSQSALLLSLHGGGQIRGVVRSASGGVLAGAQIQVVGLGADGAEKRYGQGAVNQATHALVEGQRFIERGELGVLLGPIPLVPPAGAHITRIASAVSGRAEEPSESVPLGRSSRFTTDALGRYVVFGVDPGRYRVQARHPDFADAVSKPIEIRSNANPVRRNVVLHSGSKLTGIVLTDKGVAIVGASVFARFSDGREQALAVTANEGTFAFSPMSGRIELVVEAVGYGRFRKPIKLGSGGIVASATHLEVWLAKADAIMEGRLVDGAGFPIRDATVALVESEVGLPVRPARTGPEGVFRLDGLLPGKHSIRITHPDYPPHLATVPAASDVEVTVPLGAALAIRVTDEGTEAALPMVDVVMIRADGGELRSVTDAGGKALFSAIPAIPVVVETRLPGYATLSKKISLRTRASRSAPPQAAEFAMSRGSILAGIVMNEDGDRVEGAVLKAGASTSTSDWEGRFRLEDVPSGMVVLKVESAGVVTTERLEVESGEERVTMEVRVSNDAVDNSDENATDADETEESQDEGEDAKESQDNGGDQESSSDEESSD